LIALLWQIAANVSGKYWPGANPTTFEFTTTTPAL
jgi:hypothetical protein